MEEAERLLKKSGALALKVNGEVKGLEYIKEAPPETEAEVLTFDSTEGREVLRHSASHILAHAVKKLFPEAKLAIGPAIEEGFYYDFDIERHFTPEDLENIEKKMSEIIKAKNPFIRKVLPKAEAIGLFKGMGEDYKVELIGEIPDETVSLYEEGDFIDPCRGPHLPSTDMVSAFKLLSVAGAYWRGDEKRKMLQRIYGTAFADKKTLSEYLNFLEEVKRRDHRRLGRELDLFSISDDIGAGLILWHPSGAVIRSVIEDFWRKEHYKAGYKILYTPHIAKLNLWQRSGHLEFYRENMYSPMEIEGIEYEIKPMNCPYHIAVYKSTLRSYREFPIKYAELGTVYRYERSGVLHGLLRVRGFTQDDAHIFLREDQINDEILKVLDFTIYILKTFGFGQYDICLSTRPEKYVGTPEMWEKSTDALRLALETRRLPYKVDAGAGAFYGPKIDILVKDSLGRAWQCSTLQVDFNNPERFDIAYRGRDGKDHRPIMLHRALMGSLERFFGILIEHYGGAFPLWLAPVQAEVLSIAERHADYALEVLARLRNEDIRAEANLDNEKIGHKIREATIRKVPYLVIIGDRESAEKKITVRNRKGENSGPLTEEDFILMLKDEIKLRR